MTKKSPASAATKGSRTAGSVDTKAITWACLDPTCPETGTTDRGAEKHTKATTHATTTSLSGRVAAGRTTT